VVLVLAFGHPPSALLQAVLGSLRDHPHDSTPTLIARRLGAFSERDIAAALEALHVDGLVATAAGHWQLSHNGWKAARRRLDE
jgi:hypothetical protein